MPANGRPPRARAVAAPPPPRGAAVLRWLPSGRSVLLALLILAVGVGGYLGARETSVFAVRAIEVRGAEAGLARDVRDALEGLRGASLVEVDRRAVERQVLRLPWVADLTYDRAFPNTLRVAVVPQEPAAVLRRGAESWLASKRGRVLERVPPRARLGLPRVWLARDAEPKVGSSVPSAAAPAVAALAEAAQLPRFAAIRAAKATDTSVVLVLRSGVEVRLGEAVDIPLKLAIASRLLPEVAAPGYVDLSVPERPVLGGNPQVEG